MRQIESFISHWRRTVLFMLLGGLTGWILWMFLPQEYTAMTRLSTGIDYNRTGNLDNLEEDRLLGVAEDILHSDDVMQVVFQQSEIQDYETFFKKTLISRTNDTWRLSITGKDPKKTGESAVLWLETAYKALQIAKEHAVRAEALQNELDGMTMCIQDRSLSVPPAGCPDDPGQIIQNINAWAQSIRQETEKSHGLSAALQIGSFDPGQLEIRHASRSAAVETLFGSLAGLLLAFAIVWFSKNEA